MPVSKTRKKKSWGKKGTKGGNRHRKKKHWTTTKKRKNCHPSLINKTIHSESCLTPETLSKIQKQYNQKHPTSPLLGKSDAEIYQQLTQRFTDSCKEEKCWIQKLMKENEIKHLYRPTSPEDWNKNPVEWLSNFDIEAVMNQYEETYPEFEFLGPVPIDFDKRSKKGDNSTCVSRDVCAFGLAEKIQKGKTKIGIVFNLSPSTSSGSHWVSLYVHLPNTLRRPFRNGGEQGEESGEHLQEEHERGEGGKKPSWGKNTAYCFFFDSAGEAAPKEIEELVKRLQKEWKNNRKINPRNTEMYYDCNNRTGADHQHGNTECGVYSIFFLTTMLTGKCAGGGVESENCAISLKTEQQKVDYFMGKNGDGKKIRIPDDFMVKLRKLYFNPFEPSYHGKRENV